MIGKSYFLLSLLQAALSQEWKAHTLRDVTVQEGACAQIPCHYSYPSSLANQPRVGVWFNNEVQSSSSIVFHSNNHNQALSQFRHRTRLSGDLKDGDCSLIINDITQEDAGPYFFRIKFDKKNKYNYHPVTQLHVSDFTDQPTIFPAEIIAGKSVDVSCNFNTKCNGTAPVLNWVTPTDVPGSVSNSVTQHSVTLTYTSVLTLIPSLKHQGQTLTCRVIYPSVSSERTLTLTVQYAPRNLSITSPDMIKDSSINIIEGNSTVMICSVESFPASNLTWRHLNVTMNRTRSNNELWLVFPHVTSRDTGDYQCVAENVHGAEKWSITITVEHPPKETTLSISGASGRIKKGSNVTLTCTSKSNPPASDYSWFRIEGNSSTQLNTSAQTVSFTHVTWENDARFYCTARNPRGHGTSHTVHLNVEYKPEISRESTCARRAEGVICVCTARSNPPGDLTWHLPHANASGNRTQGGFVAWRVVDGHLVTGSLTLTGHQGEEDVTASCIVRNPHGEAMFKVYLWVKEKYSHEWRVGLLTAVVMLSVVLTGILLFTCVRRRKTATEERASETRDIELTNSPLSRKYQRTQNMVGTEPWNTSSDTTREVEIRDLSEGPAAKTEDILYASINFSKLPRGGEAVNRCEVTEYAEIRFQ